MPSRRSRRVSGRPEACRGASPSDRRRAAGGPRAHLGRAATVSRSTGSSSTMKIGEARFTSGGH